MIRFTRLLTYAPRVRVCHADGPRLGEEWTNFQDGGNSIRLSLPNLSWGGRLIQSVGHIEIDRVSMTSPLASVWVQPSDGPTTFPIPQIRLGNSSTTTTNILQGTLITAAGCSAEWRGLYGVIPSSVTLSLNGTNRVTNGTIAGSAFSTLAVGPSTAMSVAFSGENSTVLELAGGPNAPFNLLNLGTPFFWVDHQWRLVGPTVASTLTFNVMSINKIGISGWSFPRGCDTYLYMRGSFRVNQFVQFDGQPSNLWLSAGSVSSGFELLGASRVTGNITLLSAFQLTLGGTSRPHPFSTMWIRGPSTGETAILQTSSGLGFNMIDTTVTLGRGIRVGYSPGSVFSGGTLRLSGCDVYTNFDWSTTLNRLGPRRGETTTLYGASDSLFAWPFTDWGGTILIHSSATGDFGLFATLAPTATAASPAVLDMQGQNGKIYGQIIGGQAGGDPGPVLDFRILVTVNSASGSHITRFKTLMIGMHNPLSTIRIMDRAFVLGSWLHLAGGILVQSNLQAGGEEGGIRFGGEFSQVTIDFRGNDLSIATSGLAPTSVSTSLFEWRATNSVQ